METDVSKKDAIDVANAINMPVDSILTVAVDDDRLFAYIVATAPHNGGAEVSRALILDALKENGIVYGIHDDIIDRIVNEKLYNRKICIAQGSAAVDGENGEIEYLYDRKEALTPKLSENNLVDYKDLGLVQNIEEGTVIAKITPPLDGKDGTTIFGETIPALNGKAAKYSLGTGTILSEDETEIRALISGNLRWENGRFFVDETLIIKEDVFTGTGNISYNGDIIIKGGVLENFTVISKKNITINGTVTGATIIADGNIKIGLGCVNSDIIAKGNIDVSFCENSKIECEQNLTARNLIMCDVFCGGTMSVVAGKGIIMGGKYTSIEGLSANIIGSETFIKTVIIIGNSAVLQEEKLENESKINNLEGMIKKLVQVSNLLQEHKKKFGILSPDREEMLSSAIRSRFVYQREILDRKKRIKEIDAELMEKKNDSIIVKKQIYPGVRVSLGTTNMTIKEKWSRVSISEDNETGELMFTPYKEN